MARLTQTKFFIDGGDPAETAAAAQLLSDAGYDGLDGQTTNPSLVANNPDIAARVESGDKLSKEELLAKYKEIVQDIDANVPGDISVEVYADQTTTAEDMIEQAREMAAWSESAVIKLPVISEGLRAAAVLKDEVKLNLTLCFSQSQAAAVYAATVGSKHPVFISPFVGRLDDAGLNGVHHVRNVLQMYEQGDDHVHVLAASFRRIESVQEVLRLQVPAVTINFALFEPWARSGFPLADDSFTYESDGADILYENISLDDDWEHYDLRHELTDVGLQRFADDWNSLLI